MSNQIFTDGCTKLGTSGSPSLVYTANNGGSYVASKGRFGGNALLLSGAGAYAGVAFTGNPASTQFAFAFQLAALPGSGFLTTLCQWED